VEVVKRVVIPEGTEPVEVKVVELTVPDHLIVSLEPASQVVEPGETAVFLEIITLSPDVPKEWICTRNLEATVVFHVGDLAKLKQVVRVHPIPPVPWCLEAVNPHGNNVPGEKRSDNAKSKAINPDGFYEIQWPKMWVEEGILPRAMWAGTVERPMAVELPPRLVKAIVDLNTDVVIKLTEAPGAAPSIKKIGSTNGQAAAVMAHITLPSDLVLTAAVVDPDGNVWLARTACLVPPPPK
jgi:hypothetical protein